jgi:uncharacterized protein (TIGR00251 family)
MIPIQHQDDGFTLPVRATPRAGRTGVDPFQSGDEAVRIKITEAPEDGKANQAIIVLLSKALSVRKKQIILLQGTTNRNKLFKIVTDTPEPILEKLAQALGNVPTLRHIY